MSAQWPFYSEADANSMHVQLADEAICIGKAAANESYLRIDRIISAAERLPTWMPYIPATAFCPENAHFADVCESCNIRFIGPNSRAMNALEDKAVSSCSRQESRCSHSAGFRRSCR
jgi:acetyl-CoA carboxylase biotin carboxylase subunit